eukprot:1147941-Pelagomonas_calceolata.AAC.5
MDRSLIPPHPLAGKAQNPTKCKRRCAPNFPSCLACCCNSTGPLPVPSSVGKCHLCRDHLPFSNVSCA